MKLEKESLTLNEHNFICIKGDINVFCSKMKAGRCFCYEIWGEVSSLEEKSNIFVLIGL